MAFDGGWKDLIASPDWYSYFGRPDPLQREMRAFARRAECAHGIALVDDCAKCEEEWIA